MPTPRKKYRTYCKTCKDFTVHNWETKNDLSCETCNTIEDGYKISEVEPHLIEQQRKRYTKMRTSKVGDIYQSFMMGTGLKTLMELENISQHIIECDAGQKEIDEKRKQRRLDIIEERRKIKEEFDNNYKNLGRNDKCSCGSGKKFKKCHLLIFREKGIKF